jgi:AraC-like DNA-binding protein
MDETILDKITLGEAITPIAALFSFYIFILILANFNQNRKPNIFLAFLVLQITLVLTVSSLIILNYNDIAMPFLFLLFPMFMFIAPTCYCYIKALTTENYRFTYPEKYHMFFPSIFFLVSFILNMALIICRYLGFPESEVTMQRIFMAIQDFALDYFLLIQFVIYSIWMIVAYLKHTKSIKNYFSHEEGVKLKWIWFYILGFIFMHFLITVSSSELFFFYNYISYEAYDIIYISVVFLFTAYIGFNGVKQKSIYERKTEMNPLILAAVVADKESNKPFSTEKEISLSLEHVAEENPKISEAKKQQLKESLLQLFEQKKIYLNGSLTIEDIAEELKSNRTYISYVVNECFQKNFYNFVNELRIKEAQSLLADSKYDHYSMEGIGKIVGFKSKSSFNAAFKKYSSKTPSEFKSGLK